MPIQGGGFATWGQPSQPTGIDYVKALYAKALAPQGMATGGAPPPPPSPDPNRPPDAPGTPAGGWTGMEGQIPMTGGAQGIFQALLDRGSNEQDAIFNANREKMLTGVIPAAEQTWGDQRILAALQSNWMKAIYAGLSAVTGKPYYDRGDDPNAAKMFYVPGYHPQGYAETLDPNNNPNNYWLT